MSSRLELINREKEIVNLNEIAKEECMNLMVGGVGGFISEEQQRYRSICGGKASKISRDSNPELKKKFIDFQSKKMKKHHKDGLIKYDTFTGKKHSPDTIKLMQEKKKNCGVGSNNSQYGTCWITKKGINKKIKLTDINEYINIGWIKGRQ